MLAQSKPGTLPAEAVDTLSWLAEFLGSQRSRRVPSDASWRGRETASHQHSTAPVVARVIAPPLTKRSVSLADLSAYNEFVADILSPNSDVESLCAEAQRDSKAPEKPEVVQASICGGEAATGGAEKDDEVNSTMDAGASPPALGKRLSSASSPAAERPTSPAASLTLTEETSRPKRQRVTKRCLDL